MSVGATGLENQQSTFDNSQATIDVQSLFKVTNIKCECYDRSFCDFSQCELKVLGRGEVGVFIHAKMHQLPLKKVLLNLSLFRKFSGYRPFMYNVTVDFCDYIRNPKRFPWFGIVHDAMVNFTNANHSCPYNHDIIVSKMVLSDKMLEKTPFPTGSYMFQLIAGNPKWQGITQIMTDVVEVER
ncbi:uncharacterized protein LOC108108401 [Drosophila eugracilis]|uniref:uncharacterized protein LOC108108401 n=1 Tax=Drosophila eugracilis TaxID=29029 RepID=UPI0007E6F235|nr:uncharacterized protein LOC108108401 [Drosophila eugracilis]